MASDALRWTVYDYKHRASRDVPWKKAVQGTRRGPAKYVQDLTDEEHKTMELACVTKEHEIKTVGQVALFWKDMGRVIGASNGIETRFIYVEVNLATKDVHGCPITAAELKRLGVTV